MSSSAYALIWQRLFQHVRQLPRKRILFFYWISLVILGVYGWGLYLPFVGGRLPGLYWVAVAYHTVFLWVAVLLLAGLIFGGWIVLAIAILVLCFISFWQPWRRARRIAAYLAYFGVLWFVTLIALTPAVSYTYGEHQALTVKPWGKTYRTAHVASLFEDLYGDTMVSECNALGWCHQIYRDYTEIVSSSEKVKLFYDSEADRMKVESELWVYVRSRNQQLCPTALLEGWECEQRYAD